MITRDGIQKADVLLLRDKLYVGTLIKTPIGRSKLLGKYPYIAMCENGCWNWTEIYLAEHGVRCVDREKLVKDKIEEVKAYYESRAN